MLEWNKLCCFQPANVEDVFFNPNRTILIYPVTAIDNLTFWNKVLPSLVRRRLYLFTRKDYLGNHTTVLAPPVYQSHGYPLVMKGFPESWCFATYLHAISLNTCTEICCINHAQTFSSFLLSFMSFFWFCLILLDKLEGWSGSPFFSTASTMT